MNNISEYPELIAGAGIGIAIAVVAGLIFIFWLFNIFCMMAGAKVADISDRSFGKAFVASILIAWLGGIIISVLSLIHPLLGLVGLLFVPAFFIKLAYSCSLGKAVVAYIINIVTSIALTVALIVTLILGLGLSADKLKKLENSNSDESHQVEQGK